MTGTGLFASRHNLGRNARSQKTTDTRIAMFAEALAQGAPSIIAAGSRIGVSPSTATRLFARIRKQLGWQAC